jgi:hypothetical protein
VNFAGIVGLEGDGVLSTAFGGPGDVWCEPETPVLSRTALIDIGCDLREIGASLSVWHDARSQNFTMLQRCS